MENKKNRKFVPLTKKTAKLLENEISKGVSADDLVRSLLGVCTPDIEKKENSFQKLITTSIPFVSNIGCAHPTQKIHKIRIIEFELV